MKKNRTKRLLSKLLTLSMVLTLMMTCLVVLPTEVHAATNVPYLDAAGVEKTASTATEITASTNELTTGWYVVNGAVTRTETITVTGDVHLILADGCNLTVTGDEGKAGININGTNSLTIYDQSGHTGVLNVTGDQGGAGIGSGYMESGGFITINGGIINATGGDGDYDNNSGAGIGDGGYSKGIKIIINGGEIIATGGGGDEDSWTGAGIGGHESDITITGGKITATGGKNKDGLDVMGGAGIGGSGKAYVNTIIISGGTVTATGGPKAAGVGGGEMGVGGVITISGGVVNATGGPNAAGVGGGERGVGGVITISGGVVNATGGNYLDESGFASGGAGIGSGAGAHDHDGEYETTITISGTSTVTATGAFGSAGIGTGTGGGESNNSATITIDGGTVTGIGGVGGAGIGGGLMLDGGTITIKNGTVTATGGEGISGEEETIFGGTGIGGGSGVSMDDFTFPSGSGGTVSISGGLVFAKGDDSAKDIGGALDSSGGSLAISGTAAVFLRNDSSVEPVDTTTHTHKNISNHVANTTAFGIPVSWDGNFGAWLLLQLYAVTVNSGTGSGDFDEGADVSITANEPATGKVFDQWTTSDGVTFGDANNATTTFTMPAKAVTVTATYKDEAPVVKTALTDAITAANTNKGTATVSTDGTDVDPANKWVTTEVMTAYTDAIAAAQTIADKADATQTEVDDAVTALGTATSTFDGAKADGTKPAAVNKAALTDAITAANTNKGTATVSTDGTDVDPANKWVTTEVMTAYTDAIAAAQTIADKADATQTEVDDAVTALGTATSTFDGAKADGTKPAAVNKAALTDAITAANTNKGTATVSTDGTDVDPANKWVTTEVMTAYTDAIAAAQTIADKAGATQTEVNDAVTALGTATGTFDGAKADGTKPAPTYAVTVNSGTGGGNFAAGATVSITANEPAPGKVFDKWTTTDGVEFENVKNTTTTFVMPANDVTVTATYKDISSETPDYKIIAGENGIWKKGSTKGIVIISKGDYGDFTGVNVDDIFIDPSNYTSAAGSTVVTLKPAYLETLALGTHIVTLQFGNYSVQTNLTILAADERPDESKPDESKPDDSKPNEEIPKTGDSNHTLPLIGLLLLSGSALIGVTRNKKKKKSYNK